MAVEKKQRAAEKPVKEKKAATEKPPPIKQPVKEKKAATEKPPPSKQPGRLAAARGPGLAALPSCLAIFRIGFYVVMCYNWGRARHGPVVSAWEEVFAFDHAPWFMRWSPTTELANNWLTYGGAALCLVAIRSQTAAVAFAALQVAFVNTLVRPAIDVALWQ